MLESITMLLHNVPLMSLITIAIGLIVYLSIAPESHMDVFEYVCENWRELLSRLIRAIKTRIFNWKMDKMSVDDRIELEYDEFTGTWGWSR